MSALPADATVSTVSSPTEVIPFFKVRRPAAADGQWPPGEAWRACQKSSTLRHFPLPASIMAAFSATDTERNRAWFGSIWWGLEMQKFSNSQARAQTGTA